MLKTLLLTTIIVAVPFVVSAAIIHVPVDQPTIQAGIDAAVDGDKVLVADGTYTGEGNRNIDFKGKAISLTSENGARKCIIDMGGPDSGENRGFYFHSNETSASVLKGFTICNGYIEVSSIGGAGIMCENASPSVDSCIIMRNTTGSKNGAGIYLIDGSPTLTNCLISNNSAVFGEHGAGIYAGYEHFSPYYLLTINNSTIVNNWCMNTGGQVFSLIDLKIRNCIIWSYYRSGFQWPVLSDVTYSDVSGGFPGVGNINVDPQLTGYNLNPDGHLLPGSPCRDAGTDDGAPAIDLDGNVRPNGSAVDMGAYEFFWPSVTTTFISMPSRLFKADDSASCSVSVWNAGTSALNGYPLFTILDVFGSYYFAPSFSDFDYFKWSFPPGLTELSVLPEFTWPDNVGSATRIVWYAFLMNPEMTEFASEVGVFDFGWSE